MRRLHHIFAPLSLAALLLAGCMITPPTSPHPILWRNPIAEHYREAPGASPAWLQALPWTNAVSFEGFSGPDNDARFARAVTALAKHGGGVLYFPPGTYHFKADLVIPANIILRGQDPVSDTDARHDSYALATRFEFPQYQYNPINPPPITTAFKAIRFTPDASNCGVVNIAINRGRIEMLEDKDHRCGSNRFVFGCILTNTAAADAGVPDPKAGNLSHQRWTARHTPAIHVYSAENAFVANNRISKSGDDNFEVPNYSLRRPKKEGGGIFTIPAGVVFDYDNRPGIYVNGFSLPDATPQTHPWGFRKGTLIRDNYIYCTGRSAIHFAGDGVVAACNVIRFAQHVWRPTCTGRESSNGGSTNDNRALTMRGYRWRAEGNDYLVYHNLAFDGHTLINDSEGIMHEHFANSIVKDSIVLNNRGNQYICLWDTAIDGLLIQGNTVWDDKDPPIHALGRGHSVQDLRILDNTLLSGNIAVTAGTARNIEIRNNTFAPSPNLGFDPKGGKIVVTDPRWAITNNPGFTVETAPRPATRSATRPATRPATAPATSPSH